MLLIMQLRPYQGAALSGLYASLNQGVCKPLVCLPTGSGKSAVICTFIHNLTKKFPDEKFLIAVHTQELVAQLAQTYERISGAKPAVYSASLRSRKIGKVTVAQIQSIHRHATKFGRIKLIAIDECDRMPVKGDGQYRSFLSDCSIINPDIRVVGFTATPYRLGTGLCFGPGQPFDELVYDAGIRDLIDQGFLSPLTSKDGGKPDLSGVHSRQGEFIASELEAVMTDEALVEKACDEICAYGKDRKAWLIFSSGLKHAEMVRAALAVRGIDAPVIEGNTPDADRKRLIDQYRNGLLRCLININVLSVGFDAPHVDMLVLLRPTQSPGLYYQQVGRGLRICVGKTNCLVLDLAGNIGRHGPIDTLNDRVKEKKAGAPGEAPTKTCDQCKEIVAAGCRVCPVCQHPFPELAIAKHDPVASVESPLFSGESCEMPVDKVVYSVHAPRDPSKIPTLKVVYRNGLRDVTEWVSIDTRSHPFARTKALAWLRETPRVEYFGRSLTVEQGMVVGHDGTTPHTVLTADDLLSFVGTLAKPISVLTTMDPANPKYRKVAKRTFA